MGIKNVQLIFAPFFIIFQKNRFLSHYLSAIKHLECNAMVIIQSNQPTRVDVIYTRIQRRRLTC